jgi:hypothetical protein
MISISTTLYTFCWLEGIVQELQLQLQYPMVYTNRLNCITMLCTSNCYLNSRYLDNRYYSIYKSMVKGLIVIIHKENWNMIANTITKTLPRPRSSMFHANVGLISIVK